MTVQGPFKVHEASVSICRFDSGRDYKRLSVECDKQNTCLQSNFSTLGLSSMVWPKHPEKSVAPRWLWCWSQWGSNGTPPGFPRDTAHSLQMHVLMNRGHIVIVSWNSNRSEACMPWAWATHESTWNYLISYLASESLFNKWLAYSAPFCTMPELAIDVLHAQCNNQSSQLPAFAAVKGNLASVQYVVHM